MGETVGKLRRMSDTMVAFWCPGCDVAHTIPVSGPNAWGWNSNSGSPTFTPSIKVTSGHYARPGDVCWCTYNAEHPDDPSGFQCSICHSFVTSGKIQFLDDSTHALAGQTVELPAWE